MRASGQDKRGQGSAKATIVSSMRAEGEVTHVGVETDFTITGRLARFGRGGMIQDVSNRLLRDFATCLSTRLAEPSAAAPAESSPAAAGTKPPSTPPPSTAPPATAPDAEPLKGGSLFFSVLWERIKSLFRRR
jgi:hypothetical protein